MSERYLGIDLAGHGTKSSTGFAVLEVSHSGIHYWFKEESTCCGEEGLEMMAREIRASKRTAVDQPFSFPSGFLHLLTSGAKPPTNCLWRRTDEAMRSRLKQVRVPTNYVLSPTACRVIWRALVLAQKAGLTRDEVCLGQSAIVETHPRLALTCLLAELDPLSLQKLIVEYKGEQRPEAQKRLAREKILTLLEGISLQARGSSKETAVESDDQFEALICAVVAFLLDYSLAEALPRDLPEEILRLEGAVIVPKAGWLPHFRSAFRIAETPRP